MRITRLRLKDFRGWPDLDLRPSDHVLLTGVPRAGRSDIVAALKRALDPASIRMPPSLGDIRQTSSEPTEVSPAEGVTGSVAYADYAEVEVTLTELDAEFEQLCEGHLEPQDAQRQASEADDADPDAAFCVRICYRVTYDRPTDLVDHVLYFPANSNPRTGQFSRVPAATRKAISVVVLDAARPLQLRAEGMLRQLVTARDPVAAAVDLEELATAVATATAELSGKVSIADTVNQVLSIGGVGRRLGDSIMTSNEVQFQSEDGSLSALLRSVQPALRLDVAGLLPLSSHGSTASAVLMSAEALAAATPGSVVIADDFGDHLDAATAEHFASALRERATQLWLSTRRPESSRAFLPSELVRLTRLGGIRQHHVLEPITDRKELSVLRVLHSQLLTALTAPVVAIVEGPHDLTTYGSADRRRGKPALPLSAYGVRLISADNGAGGGTSQIPRIASFARSLGFRVIGLVDCDHARTEAATLPAVQASCDVVVRLPTGMALEQALIAGVPAAKLRTAAQVFPAHGMTDPTIGKSDAETPKSLVRPLHKGLHEPFLDALYPLTGLPPVLASALDAVALAADAEYSGPMLIDLPSPSVAD